MRPARAVSHVHSEWSYDARWKLDDLVRTFNRRHCSVIMSTEHDRGFSEDRFLEYREQCARASNEDLIIVPGIEYSDPNNTTHVLVWGNLPFLGEGLPTGELLEQVHDQGGYAVLAHPWRKDAWEGFDPEWAASYLYGIELWNRRYDGWAPEPRVVPTLHRWALLPFAGLDFHESRQLFPLRMRLWLDGDLSEQSVLEALRTRNCAPLTVGIDPIKLTSGTGSQVSELAESSRRYALRTIRRTRHRLRGLRER